MGKTKKPITLPVTSQKCTVPKPVALLGNRHKLMLDSRKMLEDESQFLIFSEAMFGFSK
jgi:hypothetical protein